MNDEPIPYMIDEDLKAVRVFAENLNTGCQWDLFSYAVARDELLERGLIEEIE